VVYLDIHLDRLALGNGQINMRLAFPLLSGFLGLCFLPPIANGRVSQTVGVVLSMDIPIKQINGCIEIKGFALVLKSNSNLSPSTYFNVVLVEL